MKDTSKQEKELDDLLENNKNKKNALKKIINELEKQQKSNQKRK